MRKLKHILIVDESEDNLKKIKNIFSEFGFCSTLFKTGYELLKFVHENTEHFDAILLDLMRSEFNTLHVLEALKEKKRALCFKICVLSAENNLNIISKINALSDDFIKKPFDNDVLMNRIKNLLTIEKSNLNKTIFSKVTLKAELLNTPILTVFNIIGLSEEGIVFESKINFREQATILISSRNLSNLVDVDQNFYLCIVKVKIEKEFFLVFASFIDINNDILQKIKDFLIKNSVPLDITI